MINNKILIIHLHMIYIDCFRLIIVSDACNSHTIYIGPTGGIPCCEGSSAQLIGSAYQCIADNSTPTPTSPSPSVECMGVGGDPCGLPDLQPCTGPGKTQKCFDLSMYNII